MPAEGRKLDDWIDGFMQYTENSEPPKLFRKWTAISCIAAALQRKVRVDWGAALTFFPNLYIILVGPSATGKGTAMNPGLKIIQEIPSIHIAAQATSYQALIQSLKNTNLTDIDHETGQQHYHASMTIFSKEFTVFLGYHNRELMSALCDWYDCDNKWEYKTVQRKSEEIIGVWVNMIGGTTPDLIRSSLPVETIGGGLTSRIIFIFEERPNKLVTLPTETDAERGLFEYLVRDLEQISLISGSFRWTEGFASTWDSWCREAANNPPFYDKKFDGYTGRRRVHLIKLAMICSASHGNHELALTQDDLERAALLLSEAEVMMDRTFRGLGQSNIAELIYRATAFFVTSRTDQIPVFQFIRHFSDDMDKWTMDRVLDTMEASKLIQVVGTVPGGDPYIKLLPGVRQAAKKLDN